MLNHYRYGQGPPLVLQHGFMGGNGYWLPLLPRFGRHFDVIAADLPGFAGSGQEPHAASVQEMSAALIGLLDALEVERTALLGHSMGGMVALQTALDHPHRITRLVLYGTACMGDLPKRFETIEATVSRLRSEGAEACADHIVPTWFVEGTAAPFYRLCREAGRGVQTAAAVAAMRALAGWNVCERLSEIAMPSLVICGDRDRSTAPDQSYRLWQGLPDGRLCIVPGCAHNVHLERTALFADIVLDFLLS